MSHHSFHLRLDQAAAVLAKLREAVEKRKEEAGPQQFKDHDRSSRYLANRLPTYNPK